MEKKGSITVFLALILRSPAITGYTSIQSNAAGSGRTQILNSMDIGSLFSGLDSMIVFF